MALGEAIDFAVKGSQTLLNALQVGLISLATYATGDQQVDDDADFQQCVDIEDQIGQTVAEFCEQLQELARIAGYIRGDPPTPLSAKWYAGHKRELKARQKQEAIIKQNKRDADTTQKKLAAMSLD